MSSKKLRLKAKILGNVRVGTQTISIKCPDEKLDAALEILKKHELIEDFKKAGFDDFEVEVTHPDF